MARESRIRGGRVARMSDISGGSARSRARISTRREKGPAHEDRRKGEDHTDRGISRSRDSGCAIYCSASRFVNLQAFRRARAFTQSEQFGVRMACLRFGAGGLALCGAERQGRNGAHRTDPVRQASLSKAEASHPHSKVFTSLDARQYSDGGGDPARFNQSRQAAPGGVFPFSSRAFPEPGRRDSGDGQAWSGD